jgi:cytochrome P450/ferredoxin-NADP reductase
MKSSIHPSASTGQGISACPLHPNSPSTPDPGSQSDERESLGCPVGAEASSGALTGTHPFSSRAAEFDPFEGAYQVDPADSLRWSRDEEPVFFSPKLGYWIVTRYDDVKAIFRNNILFSPSIALEKITPAPPEAQEILKQYGYAMDRTMVNEDEPAHMERRRLLMDSFSPEALAKHETSIRQLTQRYVDRFIDKGEVDLVAEMLWEIPLTVALHFLGVRDDDIDELRQFCVAHTINTWGRPSLDEQLHVADSVGRFWRAANRVLDRMMENPAGEGWMYFSIRQHLKHPDVVPLSYLRSMMMAILVAAHETTSKATTNAMRLLLSDKAVWNQICADPGLIPMAVEECLRRAGSIVSWRRIATAPARVGDVEIPKGAKLLLVMASANHDERKFENPNVLDLHRENTVDHLSFGYGAHQCMGKNIARMEMRIFLEEFARRLPHMELVPDQEFKYLPNTSFRGPESLWVRWNPEHNPEHRDATVRKPRQSFKVGPPARADIARPVRVVSLDREADRILRIVLEAPDGRDLPTWAPGAHIHVLLGEYERRYSLCGDRDDRKHYELRVLMETAGKGGSRHIHERLRVGDMLRIRGPKNHFRLDESASNYLLIAGGIGITPIVAMADRLKHLGKRYGIHYAGRAASSMALLEKLRRDHGKNLQLYPASEGARMDLRALAEGTAVDRVYACGPDRLLGELVGLSRDWPENTLHKEHFTSAQAAADPSRDRPFEIELRDSQVTLQVPPDKTALDVLEAAGIDVACDCREGLCGSCEVQVIEGEVEHRDRVLSQSERARNTQMITCCSRARGGKIVLAL